MANPSKPSVPYIQLDRQFADESTVMQQALEAVMASGFWVGGPDVAAFEAEISSYCASPFAVSVGSGTDALILSLLALDIGPGDEVITPPNSFVSSAAAIARVGATPVFADVLADQNIDPQKVEAAVTPRTKAIMPVHLTGRIADMDALNTIAERHGLSIIEDAAQAAGSRYRDRYSGTIGTVGCFSTHPLKNLNAMGDGGFVLTGDEAIAQRLRRLRNNGMSDRDTVQEWGVVSRMDSLQAAVLRLRLKKLDEVIARRRANAEAYRAQLKSSPIFMPSCRDHEFNSFHTFVIQTDRRDALQQHLTENGIGSAIHYPTPIHLQPAAIDLKYKRGDFPVAEQQAGRILSLPISQFLSEADIRYVSDTVNGFFQ